jgi:hypothetical protein
MYMANAVHFCLKTGCFYEEVRDFSDPAVGWDGIINQLVSSATETENTNDMLMGTSAVTIIYTYYYIVMQKSYSVNVVVIQNHSVLSQCLVELLAIYACVIPDM